MQTLAIALVLFAPAPFREPSPQMLPGVHEFYEGNNHLRLSLEWDGTYYLRTFDHKIIHCGDWTWNGKVLDLCRDKLDWGGVPPGKKGGYQRSTRLHLTWDKENKQWRGWGYEDTSWMDRRLRYKIKSIWPYDKRSK